MDAMKSAMKDVRLKISEQMLEAIDLAIEIGQASNRSEFIRMSVSNQLRELTITAEMKKKKFDK